MLNNYFKVISNNQKGMKKIFLCFSLYCSITAVYCSITAAQTLPPPLWAKDLIIYEMNTKGFTSPEGPETGTFNSTREHIPYLKDLGITGVWLSGHSWGDHRHFYNIWTQYACIRPDSIDPTLGTRAELKAMVDEFHQNGIKVFLDIITHGVINYSPLICEHPDWFKGGSWGMTDYDWKGDHKDLGDWWVKTHTDYAIQCGVDGFRIDLLVHRPDLWRRIKEESAKAGHPVVVFRESYGYEPESAGVNDFFQQSAGSISTHNQGIDKKVHLWDNPVKFYAQYLSELKKTEAEGKWVEDNFLESFQLSCHDNGWDGFPLDANPYVSAGSRCLFGYSFMFLPAIPLFMSGEEFDADFVPLPTLSPYLFKKEKIGQGKWLYGTWMQWDQLKEKRHADMLADVKKMIALRKQESALLHVLPNNVFPPIDSLAYSCSEKIPVPYMLWDDKSVLVVAGNDTDNDINITVNIPLTKTGLKKARKVTVTDLWNGGKKEMTAAELKKFSFTVKRDRVAGGGIGVFKIIEN